MALFALICGVVTGASTLCGPSSSRWREGVAEFFRREAWRGRGSLRSLFRHRLHPNELRSNVAPLVFTVGGILGVIGLTASAVDAGWMWPSAGILGLTGLLPTLAVLRKCVSARRFVRCWILMVTYLAARGVALFWPIPRAGRG